MLPLQWYAGLFYVDHVPYILAADTGTLASVVFRASGVTSPDRLAATLRRSVEHLFQRRGWSLLLGRHVSVDDREVLVLPCGNPRLTGSHTELVRLAKWDLADGPQNLDSVVDSLNETPMSYIDMASPETFLDSLAKAVAEALR